MGTTLLFKGPKGRFRYERGSKKAIGAALFRCNRGGACAGRRAAACLPLALQQCVQPMRAPACAAAPHAAAPGRLPAAPAVPPEPPLLLSC